MLMRRFTDDQKRGLRHWAMEFVVVVAGVLLALWLQEWGQRRRAISDMRAAEGAIHDEVRTALESIMWRQAIARCHIDRTRVLQSMLLKSEDTWPGLLENALVIRFGGPPTIFPSVYSRPFDTFTSAAWTSALTTGALAPMDRDRFGKLVAIYDQIETWRKAQDYETEAASKLAPLAFPMPMTPELRARALQAVYEVDRSRFTFGFVPPGDFAAKMLELGWDDTAEVDRWIRANDEDSKAQGFVFRPCVAPVRNPFRKTQN